MKEFEFGWRFPFGVAGVALDTAGVVFCKHACHFVWQVWYPVWQRLAVMYDPS